jgi:hypothetical protein
LDAFLEDELLETIEKLEVHTAIRPYNVVVSGTAENPHDGSTSIKLRNILSLAKALILFFVLFQQSYCDELILPGNAATLEGEGDSSYPFRVANGRIQQFYDSTSFATPTPVLLLEGVAFRVDNASSLHQTYDHVTLILSTTRITSNQYVQGNWEANHGPDRTVVFDGAIRFDNDGSGSGTPAPFGLKILFTTPFAYDPSKGNLMLDVFHDRASGTSGGNLDVFNSFSPIGFGVAQAPGGSRVNGTLATDFFYTAVPEPSAACFGVYFIGLVWFTRKISRRQEGSRANAVFPMMILAASHLSVFCDELILPGNAATQEGPDYSSYPLRDQNGRAQQFYDSSSFVISQPVLLLEAVAFRVESSPGPFGSIHETLNRLTVILSTTQITADQYHVGNWEANHGPDRTVVFDGPIRFDSDKPAGGGPAPFDLKITFTTPFTYDPSKGNLMLDVYHDRPTGGGANLDLFVTSSPFGYGNALGPGGSRVNATLATEFFYTAVPEPTPFALLGSVVGLVALNLFRRKRYALV